MKTIANLDGLRAFAVAGVLVSHCAPKDWPGHVFPWGHLGVQLFYAISGFLITGILLDAAERHPGRPGVVLKTFYARRFLRIFPPYYALLGLVWLSGIGFPDGSGPACFFYYINLTEAARGLSYPYLNHLWSLCIEEQFYLLWPWVVLGVSAHWRSRVLGIFFLSALAAKVGFGLAFDDGIFTRNMPISNFDTLAGGAFLAWNARRPNGAAWGLNQKLMIAWLAVGIVLHFLGRTAWMPEALGHLLQPLGISLVLLAVVEWAFRQEGSRWSAWLRWPPLNGMGKISYGIYLYHFIVLLVLYKIIKLLGQPAWLSVGLGFTGAWLALTLLTATVSWFCFERPILSLKRYFVS